MGPLTNLGGADVHTLTVVPKSAGTLSTYGAVVEYTYQDGGEVLGIPDHRRCRIHGTSSAPCLFPAGVRGENWNIVFPWNSDYHVHRILLEIHVHVRPGVDLILPGLPITDCRAVPPLCPATGYIGDHQKRAVDVITAIVILARLDVLRFKTFVLPASSSTCRAGRFRGGLRVKWPRGTRTRNEPSQAQATRNLTATVQQQPAANSSHGKQPAARRRPAARAELHAGYLFEMSEREGRVLRPTRAAYAF